MRSTPPKPSTEKPSSVNAVPPLKEFGTELIVVEKITIKESYHYTEVRGLPHRAIIQTSMTAEEVLKCKLKDFKAVSYAAASTAVVKIEEILNDYIMHHATSNLQLKIYHLASLINQIEKTFIGATETPAQAQVHKISLFTRHGGETIFVSHKAEQEDFKIKVDSTLYKLRL